MAHPAVDLEKLDHSGNLQGSTLTKPITAPTAQKIVHKNQTIMNMANFLAELSDLYLKEVIPFVHGGHGEGGGLVALDDHFLAALTHDTPSSWSLLGGIETLGKNLHPLLLHFPIAFVFGFIFTEVYGVIFKKNGARQWASGLLYLGGIGALVADVSGLIAAETVPHGAQVHEIMQWHQRAGITVAVLTVALGIWRRLGGIPQSAMATTLSTVWTLVIGVILFLGADMGGMMVYQHGVGVKNLQSANEHIHHSHDN
jgi:uncharacterized membrane protein